MHCCWLAAFSIHVLARRSLFEKDKLLFAFTLALKLRLDAGAVGQQELRFLMTGAQGHGKHSKPGFLMPRCLTQRCRGCVER
jgi:dynein heavy chain